MSQQDDRATATESERQDERALDEGRDIAYQRREWRAQRVGWVVMTLIVVAGLLGVLGNAGPLATAETAAPDNSLRVAYTRIERHHAPAQLVVDVSPDFVEADEVRLWLDADFVRRLGLEAIVPEPDSVEVEAQRVVCVFTVGEDNGPLMITFYYRHDGYWRQEARLGLANGATVTFSQFVLP